jgi:hypothetical protein
MFLCSAFSCGWNVLLCCENGVCVNISTPPELCSEVEVAASTSETLINFYRTTWCSISEDSHLHTCRHEKLKSHLDLSVIFPHFPGLSDCLVAFVLTFCMTLVFVVDLFILVYVEQSVYCAVIHTLREVLDFVATQYALAEWYVVLTFRVVLALLFYDAPVFIGMSDNL